MTSRPRIACALACLLVAAPARAQTVQLDRFRGIPTGLAVPGTAAGAEEPTALSVNPAGVGFVGGAALQYFYEGGREGSDFSGNGAWLAIPLGPLVPALSMEWVSPGQGRGPRYRKTGLGLALAFGQVFSMGWAWNWWSSPDAVLDRLFAMDGGVTVRPLRQLSLAVSVLGLEGRLAGSQLPLRYDFGAATRILDDSLTFSVDLLANDQGREELRVTHGQTGLRLDLKIGFSLQAQYLFPLRSGQTGYEAASAFQFALSLDQPHSGGSFGVGSTGNSDRSDSTYLVGMRLSAERYRSFTLVRKVQVLDVAEVLERPSPIAALLGAEKDRYGALLRRLRQVRDDPAIAGLVVKIRPLDLRDGRIEELRGALLSVRERKPVVAYLVGGETREYLLATAAGEVFAPPSSVLLVNGLASTHFYLKDGLGKLGVAFETVAAGRYKNAPDPLTRSDMSPAEREVTASLLDDRFTRQIRTIASARGLAAARVRELVDVGVFTAEEASAVKLLDGALWPDELEKRMKASLGGMLSRSLDESPPRSAQRWGPRPYIAVMRAEGAIALGKSRTDPFGGSLIAGSESIVRLVRTLVEDGSCRAIVIRVESPGGDGLASDLIWRELKEASRKGKPVVASLGDVAASGGYLVAVAADAIVAEPSTLTGSIGVFALKADLSGLLSKLGVAVAAEQRGEKARIASVVKPWTPSERQMVERQIGAFYEAFVAKVAEGRKMSRQDVDAVAQGRVWTGEQAVSRRLVDQIGSLADGVELARRLSGSGDEVEERRVELPPGVVEGVASGLEAFAAERSALHALASKVPELRAASLLAEMGPVLALPPSWALAEALP